MFAITGRSNVSDLLAKAFELTGQSFDLMPGHHDIGGGLGLLNLDPGHALATRNERRFNASDRLGMRFELFAEAFYRITRARRLFVCPVHGVR